MDFALSPKHEMMKSMFREFAEKEVAPVAAELDEKSEFSWDLFRKMGQLGMFGIPYPQEYGGAGADYLTFVLACEEIGRACTSSAMLLNGQNSINSGPIYRHGTEEQKKKYLVPIITGKALGAFCLTEADAGTDASNQQTTAVLDGSEWVIDGTKMFITNAGLADIYIIMAMTDTGNNSKGISAFVVEKDTPGLSFGKKENKMGVRASHTAEVILQDCRIPRENLLGKEGEGFKIAMQNLDSGRIGVGAISLGIAQAALDESTKYAKERQQFGRPIGANQAIQWMIADMATELEAARYLVYRAAWLRDQKKAHSKEASMAKLFASELAMRASVKAVQIHGGYGYMKEYKVERLMRDAKVCEIFEGTSEVQRMLISRAALT
ncbi:Acyl-CoA dehydrogenase [Pelotomaculum schinkii]|uniref:Acyl-CoA dehydrogenase n=1 Tax=Pelotomaculum schinkii TaxID=78350 RepID=A0A4Y7RF14_9FIRM|nr:acyl-CoA dehydrogenase [Pelotomaculum schinkii]TEB07595.1 Acyl-CoA dehydrogenase [Pelotomaculum schinkii]